MATKHPYISGAGPLLKVVEHFRKAFPGTVSAETLKKLAVAPNNESYVLNILRLIGVIDEDGKKTETATTVFSKHDDKEFEPAFAALVKTAYADLFSLHGEDSWTLGHDQLISYFRATDGTTDVVGRRQATTFQTLSSLAGKIPSRRTRQGTGASDENGAKKTKTPRPQARANRTGETATKSPGAEPRVRAVGLTVRVEINLPAVGDQETYDRIFRSIRENLINAEEPE